MFIEFIVRCARFEQSTHINSYFPESLICFVLNFFLPMYESLLLLFVLFVWRSPPLLKSNTHTKSNFEVKIVLADNLIRVEKGKAPKLE